MNVKDYPVNSRDKTIWAFNAYRFQRPDGWTHEQASLTGAPPTGA